MFSGAFDRFRRLFSRDCEQVSFDMLRSSLMRYCTEDPETRLQMQQLVTDEVVSTDSIVIESGEAVLICTTSIKGGVLISGCWLEFTSICIFRGVQEYWCGVECSFTIHSGQGMKEARSYGVSSLDYRCLVADETLKKLIPPQPRYVGN